MIGYIALGLSALAASLFVLYSLIGKHNEKWSQRQYEHKLNRYYEWAQQYKDRNDTVPEDPAHPDFDPRSPNYIDLDAVADGDFWRALNITYYKTFPELADKHNWDLEKMHYKQKSEAEREERKAKDG